MTKLQRLNSFMTGVLMLAFCGLLIYDPKNNLVFMTFVISIVLIVEALMMLWYYFTMAKLMVGGKKILYQGVVFLDLALFTLSLSDVPLIYIILYLIAINAVAGTIDMALAVNAHQAGAPSWKLRFSAGFIELFMALLCLANLHSVRIVVFVYVASLSYTAIVKIVSAFRKTEVVYIQ